MQLGLLPPGEQNEEGMRSRDFLAPDTGQSLTFNRGGCLSRCRAMIRDAWKTGGSHGEHVAINVMGGGVHFTIKVFCRLVLIKYQI